MSRVKDLQSALTEAQARIKSLMTENRTLKTIEKRQEVALSKYEGTHAKLPQVIRSYSEDIRTLQTQLRCSKDSYKQLENRNRNLSAELAVVQKQYKHLLDLTKNKQLCDREKLSSQLEVAENTVKEHEKTIQTLLKKLEFQDKNYRSQINAEANKIEQLQFELNHKTKENERLKSNLEKVMYQNYSGRSSNSFFSKPRKQFSRQTIQPKNKLLGIDDDNSGGFGDLGTVSLDKGRTSSKPDLVHVESDVSDNTRELQKNLMQQIHEDVINRSNMLVDDKIDFSDTSKSWLYNGISELIKEKNLSDSCNDSDDLQAEPIKAGNPFSVTNQLTITKTQRNFAKKVTESDISNENNFASKSLLKPTDARVDDDDDMSSSFSLLSDSDSNVD